MKIRKVLNGLNGQIPIFYHSPTIRKHEIFFDQIAKSSYFSIYGSGLSDCHPYYKCISQISIPNEENLLKVI